MSVDVGRAIEEGGKRTLARNGLYLVVVTWVLGVLDGLFSGSVTRQVMAPFAAGNGPGGPFGPDGTPFVVAATGPSIGLSAAVAGLLSIVVTLLGLVVTAAALRTFVTDDTETLPGDRFTHNLGWLLVNLIVGWIVFAIAVAIGFVLLIVPGFFLLVSLFFWETVVAVEDENFVDGFSESWDLTRGNRWWLLLLGVLVLVISAIVSAIFGAIGIVGGGWFDLLVGQIGSAFAGVFVLATTARTFTQLVAARTAAADEESAPAEPNDATEASEPEESDEASTREDSNEE